METNPHPTALVESIELEKVREQFDHAPYPRIPLDDSPIDQHSELFTHSLITSYYLKYHQVRTTEGALILDAGCGTGYTSLILALANPGARIVGIDISEESIKLARERFNYHQQDYQAEFHVLLISDLPKLGLKFDYINCDEVLYLFPNPADVLKIFKSVLKPNGIIRANLHDAHQRVNYFRSQTLFKLMGLMDDSPKDMEREAVIETMNALKDDTRLKSVTWNDRYSHPEKGAELIFMNHLFVGDTGYSIPDLFRFLEEADLEFLNMVNWRHWDVTDLFKEPDNLPAMWALGLEMASLQDKLYLYELINPIHRLIDFWCTYPNQEVQPAPDDWDEADWRGATVHLHPQLRLSQSKQDLLDCIQNSAAFEISQYIKLPTLAPVRLDAIDAACLLPLWDGPQPFMRLVERYHMSRPVECITLKPMSEQAAFDVVRSLLLRLDAFLYVLLERH